MYRLQTILFWRKTDEMTKTTRAAKILIFHKIWCNLTKWPISTCKIADTLICTGICMHTLTPCNCLLSVMAPSPPLDIWVMVIVWKFRGNIITTAVCWIVWQMFTVSSTLIYMSGSYRSNRLGSSHWDPYAMRRSGCIELYYCNMVEWFWWDSSLILTTNWFPSCFDTVGLVIWPVKVVPKMTYNVLSGTLNAN